MDKRRRFIHLVKDEPDLGGPHVPVPDLSGKVVLVVGATYASGFGYNLGKVASLEGHADVIMTASEEAKRERLEKRIRESAFKADTAVCDVTNQADIKNLGNQIQEKYGQLDVLVITSANIDLKYLSPQIKWEDIPEEAKEACRKVTVYPVHDITSRFRSLMMDRGSAYAISFCGHDMPGYPIGGAKRELEELVTQKSTVNYFRQYGIRINILSLGPFESVSSSVVPGIQLLRQYMAELGLKEPTLGEMVRESIATFALPDTGKIYSIDEGLRDAITNPANAGIMERMYEQARNLPSNFG